MFIDKSNNSNLIAQQKSDSRSSSISGVDKHAPEPASVTVPVKKSHIADRLFTAKPYLPEPLVSNVNLNKELNILVLEVKDSKTDEVIKTIPSKEILDFMEKTQEIHKRSGILLDTHA